MDDLHVHPIALDSECIDTQRTLAGKGDLVSFSSKACHAVWLKNTHRIIINTRDGSSQNGFHGQR